MKLKNLSVGQKFMFENGNGKLWEKVSDNGGITEYNLCLCITDQKEKCNGHYLTMVSLQAHFKHRMDKEANVIIVG